MFAPDQIETSNSHKIHSVVKFCRNHMQEECMRVVEDRFESKEIPTHSCCRVQIRTNCLAPLHHRHHNNHHHCHHPHHLKNDIYRHKTHHHHHHQHHNRSSLQESQHQKTNINQSEDFYERFLEVLEDDTNGNIYETFGRHLQPRIEDANKQVNKVSAVKTGCHVFGHDDSSELQKKTNNIQSMIGHVQQRIVQYDVSKLNAFQDISENELYYAKQSGSSNISSSSYQSSSSGALHVEERKSIKSLAALDRFKSSVPAFDNNLYCGVNSLQKQLGMQEDHSIHNPMYQNIKTSINKYPLQRNIANDSPSIFPGLSKVNQRSFKIIASDKSLRYKDKNKVCLFFGDLDNHNKDSRNKSEVVFQHQTDNQLADADYESLSESFSKSTNVLNSSKPSNPLMSIWSLSNDNQLNVSSDVSDDINEPLFSQSTINSMNSLLRATTSENVSPFYDLPSSSSSSTVTDNFSDTSFDVKSDQGESLNLTSHECPCYYSTTTDYDSCPNLELAALSDKSSSIYGTPLGRFKGDKGLKLLKSNPTEFSFVDKTYKTPFKKMLNVLDDQTAGKILEQSDSNSFSNTLDRDEYLEGFCETDNNSLYNNVRGECDETNSIISVDSMFGVGAQNKKINGCETQPFQICSDQHYNNRINIQKGQTFSDVQQSAYNSSNFDEETFSKESNNSNKNISQHQLSKNQSDFNCSNYLNSNKTTGNMPGRQAHSTWSDVEFFSTISTVHSLTDVDCNLTSLCGETESIYDQVTSDCSYILDEENTSTSCRPELSNVFCQSQDSEHQLSNALDIDYQMSTISSKISEISFADVESSSQYFPYSDDENYQQRQSNFKFQELIKNRIGNSKI